MKDLKCKAIKTDDGKIVFESAISESNTPEELQEQIEYNKRFGKMVPRNGKYFTWRAEDWQGKFITHRQINYGINLAWTQVELEIPIDVKRAKVGEYADFKIYFRRTSDDPELTSNTLMYHYYPINDFNNPNRGVCVVNTDFPLTVHGNPISMHEIDPDHYPEHPVGFPEHIDPTGHTFDFDQLYAHEGPGHGLGLGHTKLQYHVMSSNYTIMAEFFTNFDIACEKAKYGARNWFKKWFYKRWINWYRVRSDRY